MKRYSLIIFLFIFVLGACDLLDNQEPQQSIPLEGGYNSVENLETALIGTYSDVQGGPVLGANYLLFPEIMADNTIWQGSFPTYTEIDDKDISVSNLTIQNVWEESYESINDANLIIDAIESGQVEGDQPTLDRIKGEALFLRAAVHFEMLRFWAKPWGFTANNDHLGVPVVTTGVASADDFQNRSRNTVAEVYSQIKADFLEAISLLPGTVSQDAGRANSLNASAYLARVNLQQGNFSEVATLTDAIISSGAYMLESSPTTYFENEEISSESVWDIIHTVQDNPGINAALPTFYDDAASGGRGDIQVAPDYLLALDAVTPTFQETTLPPGWSFEDLRDSALLNASDAITQKFPDGTNTADNAPVIRYADVLLMRAEALAELATNLADPQSNEAIELLNQIRLRSIRVSDDTGAEQDAEPFFGYDQTDFLDTQELIDVILLERRVELAFEGQRLHDLQRRQQDVTGLPYDSDNITWPIPQSETDANPEITQNPGY